MSLRAAVITFPGSNCDRDLAVAMDRIFGQPASRVWHGDTEMPKVDVIGVPGGFAYGDYLRCGAIAARSPIMAEVVRRANDGVLVIGICNGFQVLTEAGLLPGALIRNASLRFVCHQTDLEIVTTDSAFTRKFSKPASVRLPVAHNDGNYFCDPETLHELETEDRIAFRYRDNPNGSTADIAGVLNTGRNVLGLMPHPERAIEPLLGGDDGLKIFASMMAT
ncbi:MAG: phosphoribosylformylglycinamidine synthase subunit PurQ [Pseudomonadota bacterium]